MSERIHIAIVDGPLSAAPLPRCGAEAGAVVQFEGIVRGLEQGRPIAGLSYQAYDPMAEGELRRLAGEAAERFGLTCIRVEHSRGFVPAGQCSFRLAVASPHRKEGLAAMDWFIDAMKQDVPIWKQPVWADATAGAQAPGGDA